MTTRITEDKLKALLRQDVPPMTDERRARLLARVEERLAGPEEKEPEGPDWPKWAGAGVGLAAIIAVVVALWMSFAEGPSTEPAPPEDPVPAEPEKRNRETPGKPEYRSGEQ